MRDQFNAQLQKQASKTFLKFSEVNILCLSKGKIFIQILFEHKYTV